MQAEKLRPAKSRTRPAEAAPPLASSTHGTRVKARSPRPAASGAAFRALWKSDSGSAIQLVRAGVPAVVLVAAAEELAIPRERLYEALGLRRSTIESRISSKEKLSPAESNAVMRLVAAYARASAVLEDEAAARAWLVRPIRAIGGVSPLSLLDTQPGFDLVMDTLGRIEHGVVA